MPTFSIFFLLLLLLPAALMYHLTSALMEGIRGKNDNINSILSGGVAGLLFKSTGGLRAAALASLIGTVGMTTFHVADNVYNGRDPTFEFV